MAAMKGAERDAHCHGGALHGFHVLKRRFL
jgi:hypothetical protein